ncbi:MAG TPA: hypothetical protein VGQ46_06930 [Thermoanaerobaculia bacterium]|jgi:hypothetical protein|nr:hypothetical protein [Thermoanaerobaculia bacterium]
MTVRLLKLPAVLRYAAIFWTFYQFFMVIYVEFRFRVVIPGSVAHIALYALSCAVIDLLLTLALFGALDVLSTRSSGRMAELLALLVIISAAVLLMVFADAALRTWFDGAPASAFGGYWMDALRLQFHDSLIAVAFLTGLGNALRSWAAEEERKIREAELRTSIARAELEAVAAQLRPAIVSEALREIGSAVERDPPLARLLILQLANTLRASFRRDRLRA